MECIDDVHVMSTVCKIVIFPVGQRQILFVAGNVFFLNFAVMYLMFPSWIMAESFKASSVKLTELGFPCRLQQTDIYPAGDIILPWD